jgi:Amt family ammonium transporter
VLDFAGGTVIHVSAGFSGLAVISVLEKRKASALGVAHNLPLSSFGAAIVWAGW